MKANKGVEMEYRKRLDKLLDAMNKSVLYWILADYGNRTAKEMARAIQKRIKQWDKIFGSKAEDMAIWFATTVKKHTETGFRTALRGVDINRYPTVPNNVVNAVELENEDLIKSIPEKYFLGISTVAMMALMYDWSVEELQKEIEKRHGITWRRIRTIARDQTHKTNELYKKAICDNLGIKYARWVYTWRSETQRESHVAADGRLFDISKGCLIDGEYIFPGELINCYHKDTEVMTKDGFKKFTELTKNDKILTLNPETKNLEYAVIKHTFAKRIEQIVHIKGKSLDMAIDPAHTFFTYKNVEHSPKKLTLEPRFIKGIENLGKKTNKFYGSSKWIGEEPKYIVIGNTKLKPDIFCKLMGYYLSEGHINHTRNTNAVYISQVKYLDEMYMDLQCLGFKKNKTNLYLSNKDLANYLKKFGYSFEKYVPEEILNLSPRLIRIFLDAYALGDGTPRKNTTMFAKKAKTCQAYYTSSKRMMDTLTECIIKAGKAASVRVLKNKGKKVIFKNGEYTLNTDIYWITEKENKFMQYCTAKTEILPYNDFVYDIEVDKNHTLLIKDGTCIHWNSNCNCSFAPVIEEPGDEEEIKREIEKNRYYRKIARGDKK